MILSIGNLKGGVGKTTLAVNLAVAFAHHGADTILVDAEGTALTFTTIRSERGAPGYTAVGLQGDALRGQIRQLAGKYRQTIIDLGGEDSSGSLRAALVASDVILLPVKPRSFDLWQTEKTLELVADARGINTALVAVAVLNEADKDGPDNRQTLDALRDVPGLHLAPVTLRRRKSYPNSAANGFGVVERRIDRLAGDEIRQLVEYLLTFDPQKA